MRLAKGFMNSIEADGGIYMLGFNPAKVQYTLTEEGEQIVDELFQYFFNDGSDERVCSSKIREYGYGSNQSDVQWLSGQIEAFIASYVVQGANSNDDMYFIEWFNFLQFVHKLEAQFSVNRVSNSHPVAL